MYIMYLSYGTLIQMKCLPFIIRKLKFSICLFTTYILSSVNRIQFLFIRIIVNTYYLKKILFVINFVLYFTQFPHIFNSQENDFPLIHGI